MYNTPFKRFQLPPFRITNRDIAEDANIATSKLADVPDTKDFDYQIAGVRDGINKEFQTRFSFKENSTVIIRMGTEMTPGPGYDYTEVQPNKIVFSYPVDPQEVFIFYYKKVA